MLLTMLKNAIPRNKLTRFPRENLGRDGALDVGLQI